MRALRRLLLAAVLAGAFTFAATGTGAAQPPGPVQPVALSGQDSTYLVVSHQAHMSEMISGAQAAVMGTCPQVRQLGPMLVVDHTRLDALGAAVALPNAVMLPLTPNPEQSQQLLDTAMQRGRDFDLAWLRMQERFHIQSLQAGAQQVQNGNSEQVTMLAESAAPTIEHHLEMVRGALATC